MPITTSLISGGIQSAIGIGQFIKGEKLAKQNKRPEYSVPQEISQNLSQAQMQALEGLPPEQKNEYVQNVQRMQNSGMAGLSDRNAGISGLATLTQNGNDAYKSLLSQDAAARQVNQQNLMNARTQMANYKDKSFELNKLLPFQQQAMAAQGLQGSGLQNAVGGLQSMQGSYENSALAKQYGDPSMAGYTAAKQQNPNLTWEDFAKTNNAPNQPYR